MRFCEEQLGLSEAQALPDTGGATLNPMLVCLFITYGVPRFAAFTLKGTLSALSDWERSRGPSRDGGSVKAPVTVGLLRLAVGWLWQDAQRQPGNAPQNACDACWIVVGFFGVLCRSELHALILADVTGLPGGGVNIVIRRCKTDQQGRGALVVLAESSGSGVSIGRIVLRRGGAIAAAEAGVSPELIKLHGRWRSDAVDAYLQASLLMRLSVVGSM
ncbi:hypothetical protein TSOC_013085 [Tetrabaena socialis]|uniref:Uncharacterized protein n=1 Tax=Tetrabaena socialis TaxID=47790 RepID=A0A2J7ZLA3_9CHLO|nr:hypothetical protein TSOC_013085 [Tetrabaena socialis]|eukprot:PNH01049.1 hypothetical protein TSOC_013085 [Tetrabaena socialis]